MEANQDLLASLFGKSEDTQKSEFASRLLDGEKVEIVDEIQERKKALREAKAKHIWTEEEEKERTTRTLFIGNIPAKTSKDKIEKLCEEYGKVESVRIRGLAFKSDIKVSKRIAANRGEFDEKQNAFAYVLFENVEARDKAKEGLQGKELGGNTLRTDAATPKHSKRQISPDVENRTVFICNLKKTVTEEQIRKIFASAGDIESVHIPKDINGHSRNVAYVTYVDDRDVETALKFDGALIEGREIKVKKSDLKEAKKNKKLALKKDTTKTQKPKRERKEDDDDEEDEENKRTDRPSKPNAKLEFQGMISKPEKNKNVFIKKYLKKKKHFNKSKK